MISSPCCTCAQRAAHAVTRASARKGRAHQFLHVLLIARHTRGRPEGFSTCFEVWNLPLPMAVAKLARAACDRRMSIAGVCVSISYGRSMALRGSRACRKLLIALNNSTTAREGVAWLARRGRNTWASWSFLWVYARTSCMRVSRDDPRMNCLYFVSTCAFILRVVRISRVSRARTLRATRVQHVTREGCTR